MQKAGGRTVILWTVSAAIAMLMLISYSGAQTKLEGGVNERGAPLFNDLGTHQHAISTKSAEAQKYFNQGLLLLAGSIMARQYVPLKKPSGSIQVVRCATGESRLR